MVPGKAADRSALNLRLLPSVVNLGVVDAREEEADDETIENLAAPEARRRAAERPDDRLPDRGGPEHDPGIPGAGRGGRPVLAAARRPERRGARPAAVSPVGLPARVPAPGRAGLGDGGAGVEPAGRDADDAVGGIPRRRAQGLRLQPV